MLHPNQDPKTHPDWYDLDRFETVIPFFKQHAFTMTLMWHTSLVIGFSLNCLLEALVFTGDSGTPKKALARYMLTFERLIDWHSGNIWVRHLPT